MFRQTVLFQAFDTSNHDNLWVTNGTAAGTFELTGISGANASGIFTNSTVADFTVFGNEVLFQGINASSGTEGLWVTNGTAAGTHELTGISGTSPDFDPSNM